MTAAVLLIGIGNIYRSDDGIGIIIARRLRKEKPAGVRIFEQTGEGAALIEAWQGAKRVLVIDAVQSGARPGTIHRLDARAQRVPAEFFHYSTHAFSLAEAIELARVLEQLPKQLIVYGIEGKNFGAGNELSPEVTAAAVELMKRLREDLPS